MYNSQKYKEDLEFQLNRINLNMLNNKNILITGANGLICSYIIDLLIHANETHNSNINIYALSRSEEKLKNRFKTYFNKKYFHPVIQDVCEKIKLENIDYIIHGASPAMPKLYIEKPIDTMNANYIGMLNVLECANKNNSKKVIYISSSEVYGKSQSDKEYLEESDYGYVDLLEVRSSYASSKRATETLCISYQKQHNLNVSIVRPAHIYGPTFTESDNKAVSDFLRNVTNNQDILMKSDGSSIRSYCYVGDTVVGILKVLENGISGEAYNISNSDDIISIKELASKIATYGNKKLIIELPKDYLSKTIDSNNKEIKISSNKLRKLNWECLIPIDRGIALTLDILKDIK